MESGLIVRVFAIFGETSERGKGVETPRGRFTQLVPKRPEIGAHEPRNSQPGAQKQLRRCKGSKELVLSVKGVQMSQFGTEFEEIARLQSTPIALSTPLRISERISASSRRISVYSVSK